MKKFLHIVALLIFTAITAAGESIVVIGQVLSADDASPLEAAHVWFKGTDIGTTTNEDGFFLLRSDEPQRTLEVSVVGYRTREIKLDYGKDQMVEVFMREQNNLIDEIIVIPGENPAIEILRQVDSRRHENNPANMVNLTTRRDDRTSLYLTDIKQKAFQRRLFADLRNGSLPAADSSYILPVYLHEREASETILPDSTAAVVGTNRTNTLNLLPEEHWRAIIDTYTPEANFYKTYVTILDRNFMSPIARQSRAYYHFLLEDSIYTGGNKQYVIRFRPKNDKLPLFKGTMRIDAGSYALADIDAVIPYSVNINYLNSFHIHHSFDTVCGRRYYKDKTHALGLGLNLAPDAGRPFFGAMLEGRTLYCDTRPTGDTLTLLPPPVYISPDSSDYRFERMWRGIDSLNQTRIRRLAAWIVDIGMNQYLHLWKFDIGPLLNLYHYNRLEGHSPRLTLRTGASFAKNFTVGGYFGYGTADRKYKYGGEMQWRFGPTRRNTLSVFYDRKVMRNGFDDFYTLYNENKVEDIEHIANGIMYLFDAPIPNEMALVDKLTLRYRYERKGFRLLTEAYGQKTFGNRYQPFIANGSLIDHFSVAGVKADFRLSWHQNILDNFFHPYYLSTNYPVVHLNAHTGVAGVDGKAYPFARFTAVVKQHVPLFFGRLHYTAEAAAIVGRVPYPLLFIPRGSRSWYYNHSDFMLMRQMEFLSDLYVGATIRYQTPGWLFGLIPGVKKLNLRENLIFNIAYGSLRDSHRHVLAVPSFSRSLAAMPYMECGIGISNIFRLVSVDSIWRLTYRNTPNATLWGVRFRFDLDF